MSAFCPCEASVPQLALHGVWGQFLKNQDLLPRFIRHDKNWISLGFGLWSDRTNIPLCTPCSSWKENISVREETDGAVFSEEDQIRWSLMDHGPSSSIELRVIVELSYSRYKDSVSKTAKQPFSQLKQELPVFRPEFEWNVLNWSHVSVSFRSFFLVLICLLQPAEEEKTGWKGGARGLVQTNVNSVFDACFLWAPPEWKVCPQTCDNTQVKQRWTSKNNICCSNTLIYTQTPPECQIWSTLPPESPSVVRYLSHLNNKVKFNKKLVT